MIGASNNTFNTFLSSAGGLFDDSCYTLPGAGMTKQTTASRSRRSMFWIGIVVCYQVISYMFMGAALGDVAAQETEEQSCDELGANCGQTTDELLKTKSLLRPRSSAALRTNEEHPGVTIQLMAKRMMDEMAHAMDEVAHDGHTLCEMCMEPRYRDSEKCAKFENVTSCGEAHKDSAVTDWAAGLQKLQAHLQHNMEESHEHHQQLLRKHHQEEPHALLEDIALAMCQLCMEPHHRQLAKCAQYQHVRSCEGEAHQAAVSGSVFRPHGAELRSEVRAHLAEEHRQLRALHARHTKWDAQATERMGELRHQLCADPARRNYKICRAARAHHAGDADDVKHHAEELAAHMHDLHAKHDEWDHHAHDEMHKLMEELCADPARHGYAACAEHAVAAPAPAQKRAAVVPSVSRSAASPALRGSAERPR